MANRFDLVHDMDGFLWSAELYVDCVGRGLLGW